MEHFRLHQSLQGINRTLNDLQESINTDTFEDTAPHGWQHRLVENKINALHRYLRTLQESELGNTYPEIRETVHKVYEVIDKIEEDAEDREHTPMDLEWLGDRTPVKGYVYSARDNLNNIKGLSELNPKEIAKNVYSARYDSPRRDGAKRTQRCRKRKIRKTHRKKHRKTHRKKHKKTLYTFEHLKRRLYIP